jgi:hypothetical protein
MSAYCLRPQAEGAARFTAATGVERHIRMVEITDEVFLDLEVSLVNWRNEWQRIHVPKNCPRVVVPDNPIGVTIGKPRDGAPVAALCNFFDGEIELDASDEVDNWGISQARIRLDGDFGADEAYLETRVYRFQRCGGLYVGAE